MVSTKIGVGLAGCGYWGKNLARNLYQMGNLVAVADTDSKVLQGVKENHRGVRTYRAYEKMLADATVKAVCLASPAAQHYVMAKAALAAGKDVFVEKPLALKVPEAQELVDLAAKKKRVLMVGHIL